MDWNKAFQLGQLVNAAYGVFAGKPPVTPGYDVLATIYANDLATDMTPQRGSTRVSMGLILQAQGGDAVVAIRGTEGIKEWVQDAKFGARPFSFVSGAGSTEDGFTDMYESMTVGQGAGAASVVKSLVSIAWKQTVSSLTICGHSLGGALATLLALDVAANTPAPYNKPVVYTYASPRTGDPEFVMKYSQMVSNTLRIANDVDLVPKLPLAPAYEHVCNPIGLKAITFIPPKVLVRPNPVCWHIMSTYLYLMSRGAGRPDLKPDTECASPAWLGDFLRHLWMKVRRAESLADDFTAAAHINLGGS